MVTSSPLSSATARCQRGPSDQSLPTSFSTTSVEAKERACGGSHHPPVFMRLVAVTESVPVQTRRPGAAVGARRQCASGQASSWRRSPARAHRRSGTGTSGQTRPARFRCTDGTRRCRAARWGRWGSSLAVLAPVPGSPRPCGVTAEVCATTPPASGIDQALLGRPCRVQHQPGRAESTLLVRCRGDLVHATSTRSSTPASVSRPSWTPGDTLSLCLGTGQKPPQARC